MSEVELDAEQISAITAYVDIQAPPPGPTAHVIFGTNQEVPATIVAERFHAGLAPIVILTGGINRHNGIVEAHMFKRLLAENGVPESAIRYEDQSANTWQNVEYSLEYIRAAVASGLPVTAVSKWYHRRTIHCLRTFAPELTEIYGITWEPIYSDTPVTRDNWPSHPDGRRRVLREWQEVSRRVADGTFAGVNLVDGVWQ